MSEETDLSKKTAPQKELGVSGAKIYSGMVHEEFLPELQGLRGQRVYREMRDNDATVGGLMQAFEMMLRRAERRLEAAGDDAASQEGKRFMETVFADMDHSYEDFLSDALSMLTFGWSFFEHVYKRRVGPDQSEPSRHSRFKDGLIGVRKLSPRPQETLHRWDIAADGSIQGMWQLPPDGGVPIHIPMSRAMLFRTTTHKNNPEGRSVLRNAYRAWYMMKHVQITEAVAIERELTGLPVVRIPNKYLKADTPEAKAVLREYEKIARDIRFNEQGALIVPSDEYTDQEGKHTGTRMVDVELISAAGTRTIDTSGVITRYQQDIARSVLADFLMLGSSERGSFAMSQNKTQLFLQSLQSYATIVDEVINRTLIPRLWQVNGFDPSTMPRMRTERVAPEDLETLGTYIERISRAGVPVAGDEDAEAKLRGVAGLPETYADDSDAFMNPDATGDV